MNTNKQRAPYPYLFFFLIGILTTHTYAQDTIPAADTLSVQNIDLWAAVQTSRKIDSIDIANPVKYWSRNDEFSADFNEVAFENWSAGGSNSISMLFNIQMKRTYEKKSIRWQNEAILRYGLSAEKGRKLRKTDDRIELNSTFGYRSNRLSGWFYSAKVNFKTQFDRGFDYPDREYHISRFMAPGRLYSGLGFEYGRNSDTFTLYLSPSTLKTTFVTDQKLANRGEFGVTPAVYNDDGSIFKRGKRSRTEFGVLVTNEYNVEVFRNIDLSHRLSLYTDYLENFGNIDIDWKVDLKFRVNEYIAASIGYHVIYDDATKTTSTNSAGEEIKGGAKIQWKQQLGIGLLLSI